MNDDDPDRHSFEDVARALADEVRRALDRVSDVDVDELARTASAEAERAREWFEDLARRFGQTSGTGRRFGFEEAAAPAQAPADDDALGHAGPSPLDLPSADQGRALAALDSGRWRLEPGTSAFVVFGEGPAPRDALGLVRELRVRDWMSADGEITLAGRHALKRWLEASG
jgi:hypothetical protein